MICKRQVFASIMFVALVLPPSHLSAEKGAVNKEDRLVAAPLGLTWGMSRTQIEGLGVVLSVDKDGSTGQQATARNLPRALSDAEMVLLQLGFEDKLWRIVIASKSWEHDRYGVQAKSRFDELVRLLSDRYGIGRSIISAPSSSFFQKLENFAYSISRNERVHAYSWESKGTQIELSIRSKHEDTFYVLIYEYTPLAEEVRKGKRKREGDAL